MKRGQENIIVVGAGAAGLSAACELGAAGFAVQVLEARNRIGGRILTVRDAQSRLPVELGAEFIHGETADTFSIVRAAGLVVDQLPDTHHISRKGQLADDSRM